MPGVGLQGSPDVGIVIIVSVITPEGKRRCRPQSGLACPVVPVALHDESFLIHATQAADASYPEAGQQVAVKRP
jgi:hypothetical protein